MSQVSEAKHDGEYGSQVGSISVAKDNRDGAVLLKLVVSVCFWFCFCCISGFYQAFGLPGSTLF